MNEDYKELMDDVPDGCVVEPMRKVVGSEPLNSGSGRKKTKPEDKKDVVQN